MSQANGLDTPAYQPRRAWSITALIAILMVINFLDKVVLGLVSVPMMDELKLTPVQFGLIGGSLHWCYAIAAVAGGFLANRVATRWILLGMGLLWSLVQLPIVFAESMWLIVVCRVLLGIGEGPATPVATHAVYKWFPNEKRNLPVALIHQGSAFGLLIGGLMVPVVTAHWGWRANFLVLAAVGLAWAVLWLIHGAEGNYESSPTAAAAPTPQATIPYRRLLHDPTIIANYLSHFGANWILAVIMTWLPAYLQKGLGYPAGTSGKMFALFVLITMPLGLALAWLSQRLLTRGRSSRLGRGLFIGVCLVLAGILFAGQLVPGLSASLKFVGLAVGAGLTSVVYSLGPAVLGEIAPIRQRGAILSIAIIFSSLAGFLAPLATGFLLQQTGTDNPTGYEYAFLLAGLISASFGVIGALYINPEKSRKRLLAPGTGY